MQKIQCWEGASGRLHRSQWDAAADIVRAASERDIKCLTDDPPPNGALKETVLWMADDIRANDAKLKRERKTLRAKRA